MNKKRNRGGATVDATRAGDCGPRGQSTGDQADFFALMDNQAPRHHRVEAIIADCGGIIGRVEGLGNERQADSSASQTLLVGLGFKPDPADPILSAIRSFKQKGFTIVAFADGLEQWTLGSRCHLLLAGVSHLLDSASAGFEVQLHGLLARLLEEKAAQKCEDLRTREIMAGLGVVGSSEAMLAVFRNIARISVLSDLPALITGETGTGKDLLAHAIHLLDPKRSKEPFIALNCAALSPSLAESELFGHRRGTFTGAERDRKGLIRAADGGVLFLDEIGELPLDLQPKLLRVLQENRVLTLGGEEEAPVNVRVVAATNQNLPELTRTRRFRTDLFQRLNVLHVHVPPLSQRPADVEPLVRHFLSKHRALRPAELLDTAPEFVEALAAFDLPGNVRQLENLVRRAFVSKQPGRPLALGDLPEEIWLHLCKDESACSCRPVEAREPVDPRQAGGGGTGGEELPLWENLLQTHGGNLGNCLNDCERSLLAAVFRRAQGNQSQMARVLGITPRSVYSKIRKYDLQP